MDYRHSDEWYFGDYVGKLPGRYYSLLLNFVIILLFAHIALTTEPTVNTEANKVLFSFTLQLIELFFISDYIGKLANSWSHFDYSLTGFLRVFFSRIALLDLVIVFLLLTNFYSNDTFIVIGMYILKSILSIYFSSFQKVIRRLHFIIFDSPAYTFFPLILLSIVTYMLAFFIYLIERVNDPNHFGSIVRSFWFSIVTMTTIGYGDVTPATPLGKVLAILFGIVGIICIALLTANILEANTKFNDSEYTP
tara:strand:+ start:1713 stop:2462 length:750 start_codon:yes stop_codon:yes gene_type:complete